MSDPVTTAPTPTPAAPAGTTHTTPLDEENLGGLIHRLSEQLPDLIRSEIKLGQAELAQKGKAAGIGIGLFGGAGVLGLYGFGALIATAIIALNLALDLWLSALIVTLVLFALAAVAALLGKKEVSQATPAAPEKAIAGVKDDVATVKAGHTP